MVFITRGLFCGWKWVGECMKPVVHMTMSRKEDAVYSLNYPPSLSTVQGIQVTRPPLHRPISKGYPPM